MDQGIFFYSIYFFLLLCIAYYTWVYREQFVYRIRRVGFYVCDANQTCQPIVHLFFLFTKTMQMDNEEGGSGDEMTDKPFYKFTTGLHNLSFNITAACVPNFFCLTYPDGSTQMDINDGRR
jgi:hypothetical protein